MCVILFACMRVCMLYGFFPFKPKKFAGVCHRNKQQLCALFSGCFLLSHFFILFFFSLFVLNTFFMALLTWA